MAKPDEVTVSELRANLPDLLYRTLAFGQTFRITKHGQPFAVLAPVADGDEAARMKASIDEVQDSLVDADAVLDDVPVP